MNIGFFTDSYLPDPNGVTTSLVNCARALEARGHTVYIIAPRHPGYKDKKNVIRLSAMKMYQNLDMRVALHLPERALLRVVRTDLDIIHAHAGGPVSLIGWEIARLKNIPFIFTYHTMIAEFSHYFLNGRVFSHRLLERISKAFGNMCDYMIAPTPVVRRTLLSYGVRKPIAVIPSGIDIKRFRNVKRGYLQTKLSIPHDTKILLSVSRLGREKSVDFLLQSFAHLCKKREDLALVLVGDGPEKTSLKTLAKNLRITKKVFFTGFISQDTMPAVYASADLFVFASQTETQGLVILEAMASGIPVVAVDHEAFRKAIIPHKTGVLTSNNPKEFAHYVLQILENKEFSNTLSTQGIIHVNQFSVESTTKALEKLYMKLLSHKKYKGRKGIHQTIRKLNIFAHIANYLLE